MSKLHFPTSVLIPAQLRSRETPTTPRDHLQQHPFSTTLRPLSVTGMKREKEGRPATRSPFCPFRSRPHLARPRRSLRQLAKMKRAMTSTLPPRSATPWWKPQSVTASIGTRWTGDAIA